MNRTEAPKAGWYPDPVQQARLRWWDGSDWTDDRRVGPRPTHVTIPDNRVGTSSRPISSGGSSASRAVNDTKKNRRVMAKRAAAESGLSGQDASAIVDEVRRATRSELDRATSRLTQQAGDLRSELGPLIEKYGRRFLRWARRIAVIAGVLYVLYVIASTQVQTSLLEWVGDRIDAVIRE